MELAYAPVLSCPLPMRLTAASPQLSGVVTATRRGTGRPGSGVISGLAPYMSRSCRASVITSGVSARRKLAASTAGRATATGMT
jgi:hypothetical protein